MIKYNLYEYLIELLIKGYDIDMMSYVLNFDKKFIYYSLKSLKSSIINESNETNFYIVKLIDDLCKTGRHTLTDGEIALCKMIDYSDEYIKEQLQLNNYKYLSYLKSCYYILFTYYKDYDKEILNKLRIKILNNDAKRNSGFINKKISNTEQKAIVRKNDGQISTLDSPIGRTLDLENNDFKFLLLSDTHLGSLGENLDYIREAFEYAVKEGIKYIYISGDLIEGTYSNYERCKEEYKSIQAQIDHVLNDFPYDKDIKVVILLGNHDLHSYISDNVDIYPYLKDRNDFVLLGYKNGNIKVKNSFIEMRHEITKIINDVYPENPFLTLIGHSHQFRCSFTNDSIFLKAPTTSDIFGNRTYVINKGFVVGSVSFSNTDITGVTLEYVNFEGKNIKLEKSLK